MLNTHQPRLPDAASADPRGIPNLSPANPYAAVPMGERVPTRPLRSSAPLLPPLSGPPTRAERIVRPTPALSPTNLLGASPPPGALSAVSTAKKLKPEHSLPHPAGEEPVSGEGMTILPTPPPARRASDAQRRYEPVGFPGASREGRIHPWIPGVSTPEGIMLRPTHSATLSYQREQALENVRSTASLLALSMFVAVPATCVYLVGRL